MPGRYAQVYLKAYKAAQKADDNLDLVATKFGLTRWSNDSRLKSAKTKKHTADERMHRTLAAMRAHGESVHDTNPAIPRNKWISGKVMITRSGQVKFKKGR